jgi:hypothetical protein
MVIGRGRPARDDALMQFIQPTRATGQARGPLVIGTVVGGLLVVGGLGLAWLAFATPLVRGLAPTVLRPTPDQMIVGAVVWGLSLVIPPCFAIVGAFRLFVVAAAIMRKPSAGTIGGVAQAIGDDYVAAAAVRLPDGRVIRNVVVGPFGVAVIGELPSPKNLRQDGSTWRIRRPDGRWTPMENPIERTARDADRIRHWIAAEDRDFIVKVYAAVVIRNEKLARTSACAAITADQIPAWLASLPAQRSLNVDRRDDVVERLRSIA